MFDFPTNPPVNTTVTIPDGTQRIWDGVKWRSYVSPTSGGGVTTWNTRSGAVTLSNADVIAVLPGSGTAPVMDGVATVGTLGTWAHADHVHPSDTSLVAASGGTLTGGTLAGTTTNSGTISGGMISGATISSGTLMIPSAANPTFIVNSTTVASVVSNSVSVALGTNRVVVNDAAHAVNTLTVGSGTLTDGYGLKMFFPSGGVFAGSTLGAHGVLTLELFNSAWSIVARV